MELNTELRILGKAIANNGAARLATQSRDNVARAVATKTDWIFCRKPVTVNPAKLKDLRFAPEAIGDTFERSRTQITKHIATFQPTTSLDEAKKIASNIYGIEVLDVKDLGVANDALYFLGKIKSKTSSPLGITKIIEEPVLLNNSAIGGFIEIETGIMYLSTAGLNRDMCRRLARLAQAVPANELKELFELQNEIIATGKMPLFKLTQYMEKWGVKASMVQELPFQTMIHEQGHRAHFLKIGNPENYWAMGKLDEIKNMGIADFSIYEDFMSEKTQNIIKRFPFLGEYASTSPCEFVAETYSALISDIKVPKEIMDLYKKYGGPEAII